MMTCSPEAIFFRNLCARMRFCNGNPIVSVCKIKKNRLRRALECYDHSWTNYLLTQKRCPHLFMDQISVAHPRARARGLHPEKSQFRITLLFAFWFVPLSRAAGFVVWTRPFLRGRRLRPRDRTKECCTGPRTGGGGIRSGTGANTNYTLVITVRNWFAKDVV